MSRFSCVSFQLFQIRGHGYPRGHDPTQCARCSACYHLSPSFLLLATVSTLARCSTSTTCPARSPCATTERAPPTTHRRGWPAAVCSLDSRCHQRSCRIHLCECSSALGHLRRAHLLSVVIFVIQGGGACHDLEECTRRCEEDGVPLCSSKNARDQIQMGGRASVWSPLPEENPAFHDWFKVSLFKSHAYAKFSSFLLKSL